jgi:dihydropteroate synthase
MNALNFSLNTLNFSGRLISLDKPLIMGILNLTPDSFSDGGKYNTLENAMNHTQKMIAEGADIIDVGAYSSRPGADDIPESEELRRLETILPNLISTFPDTLFSIDTFRSKIAEYALSQGVHMVNDISGGMMDENMFSVVAAYRVPYVLMHLKGNPQNMQNHADYQDLWTEIWQYFVERINHAHTQGIYDLIIDPGIGFAKTPAHNLELIARIAELQLFGYPILLGISRKSTIRRLAEEDAEQILPLTSALHLDALNNGVKILRVHDVKPARLVIDLWQQLQARHA